MKNKKKLFTLFYKRFWGICILSLCSLPTVAQVFYIEVKADLTSIAEEARTFSGTLYWSYDPIEEITPETNKNNFSCNTTDYNTETKSFNKARLDGRVIYDKNGEIYYYIVSEKLIGDTIKGKAVIEELSKQTLTIDLDENHNLLTVSPVIGIDGTQLEADIFLNLNLENVRKPLIMDNPIWMFIPKGKQLDYLIRAASDEGYLPVFGFVNGDNPYIETDFRKGHTVRYGIKDMTGRPCLIDWDRDFFEIYHSYRSLKEKGASYTIRFGGPSKPYAIKTSDDGTYNWIEYHALPGKQHIWFQSKPKGMNEREYDFEKTDYIRHSHFTVEEGTEPQDVWMDFSKLHQLTVRIKGLTAAKDEESPFVYGLTLNNPNGTYQLFEDDERMIGDSWSFKSEESNWISRTYIGEQFTNIEIRPESRTNSYTQMLPAPEHRAMNLTDDVEVVYDLSNYRPVKFKVTENFFDNGHLIINGVKLRSYEPSPYYDTNRHDSLLVYLPVGEHTWSAVTGEDDRIAMTERQFTINESDKNLTKNMTEADMASVHVMLKGGTGKNLEDLQINFNTEEINNTLIPLNTEKNDTIIYLPTLGDYTWSLEGNIVPTSGATKGCFTFDGKKMEITADISNYKELRIAAKNNIANNFRYVVDKDTCNINCDSLHTYTVGEEELKAKYAYAPTGSQLLFDSNKNQCGYYNNFTIYLEKDTTIVLPSETLRREKSIIFVRGEVEEEGVMVYALNYGNAWLSPRSSRFYNEFLTHPGYYKAVSTIGEVVYFEKKYGEELTIDFANPPAPPTNIDKLNDGDLKEVGRYGIDGRKLTTPTRGINIIVFSDGSVRKTIVK